jgi:hypothetical protein
MMVSRSNFLVHQHCVPEHISSCLNLPYYSIRSGTPANFAKTHNSGLSSTAVCTVSDRPPDSLSERGVLMYYVLRPSVWLPCCLSSLGACTAGLVLKVHLVDIV